MSYTYIKTGHSPLEFKLKDLQVFFSSESCLKIIETVIDENGEIKNFPGIIEDDRWISKRRVRTFPDVRYEAQFFDLGDKKHLMLWLIQPSGWHWVDDDGFGFSGDSSIMLYSLVDKNGEFLKKFELFSIDGNRYCHDFDETV